MVLYTGISLHILVYGFSIVRLTFITSWVSCSSKKGESDGYQELHRNVCTRNGYEPWSYGAAGAPRRGARYAREGAVDTVPYHRSSSRRGPGGHSRASVQARTLPQLDQVPPEFQKPCPFPSRGPVQYGALGHVVYRFRGKV